MTLRVTPMSPMLVAAIVTSPAAAMGSSTPGRGATTTTPSLAMVVMTRVSSKARRRRMLGQPEQVVRLVLRRSTLARSHPPDRAQGARARKWTRAVAVAARGGGARVFHLVKHQEAKRTVQTIQMPSRTVPVVAARLEHRHRAGGAGCYLGRRCCAYEGVFVHHNRAYRSAASCCGVKLEPGVC